MIVLSAVSHIAPVYRLLLTWRLPSVTDFGNGQNHIDIWTGSSTVNGGQDQIDCEDNLTSGGQYSIVRDPPTNYGVDSKLILFSKLITWLIDVATALFVPPDTCNTGNVYPSNPAHC